MMEQIKILSWNCGGRFRDKFKYLSSINADILVIQECENPQTSKSKEYQKFANNYIWTGETNSKGLGVFAKEGIQIRENNWLKYCLRNFISVRINDSFDLVAVWACKPYIDEYYIYQQINISNFNENTILIGDFNSNAIWDTKHGTRTHSAVVKQLESIGIHSAYHYIFNDKQGEESQNTFFLYRNLNKGYHIDHCFTSSNHIKNYTVMNPDEWIDKSDHIPILIDFIM